VHNLRLNFFFCTSSRGGGARPPSGYAYGDSIVCAMHTHHTIKVSRDPYHVCFWGSLSANTCFLPRDAMHKRGLCRHVVSVCLSVRLSVYLCVCHVRGSCQNEQTCRRNFSPSGSHTILVFPYQTGWRYFDGNPPYGGIKFRWGRQKSRF